MSQIPLGTPGGSFTTLGARSPYTFWTRDQAAGGSLTWLSAEISLKSGIASSKVGCKIHGSTSTIREQKSACQVERLKWIDVDKVEWTVIILWHRREGKTI